MLTRLIYLSILIAAINGHCSTDEEPYRLFGEKTFYELVGGKLPEAQSRAPSYCQPIHINMMVRHGARYPKTSEVFPSWNKLFRFAKQINATGRATQCSKDIQALQNWQVWMNDYIEANVTKHGRKEMSDLALRYKALFPEILGPQVSADRFWFSSTQKPQTMQSLTPFRLAMLGSDDLSLTEARVQQATEVIPPLKSDPFYLNNCERYMTAVSNNRSAIPNFKAFKRGPVFKEIIKRVTQRLGLPPTALDSIMLWRMYRKACIMEQWVERRNGAWCAPFTNEELEIMNFADDLYNYDKKSYQIPISYLKNCFVSKEIMNSLITSRYHDEREEDYLAGRFRMAHTSNVATTAANFRLYEVPEPLTPFNFESQRNRSFTFAKMIPTAGHLAFVLYRCDAPGLETDYKVQVFWNERVVPVPGCNGDGVGSLCSLDDFMGIYPTFVPGSPNECNHDEICGLPSSS